MPFLKWAGGKTSLLPTLEPLLPPGVERMRYIEPFLGGGAMFFKRPHKRALLCDGNLDLVNAYIQVRDDVQMVMGHLTVLEAEHSEERYYKVRDDYNAGEGRTSARAAQFIYLNKTCFNGLYRVNKAGKFNVPIGRSKNLRILDTKALTGASSQLKGVSIRCAGFENLLATAKRGDFIYLDPPYEPLSASSSFTAYGAGGFTRKDQARLRAVCGALSNRGCNWMLSNSDTPFIRDLYESFDICTVMAARSINSKGNKRGAVSEVVVRNY